MRAHTLRRISLACFPASPGARKPSLSASDELLGRCKDGGFGRLAWALVASAAPRELTMLRGGSTSLAGGGGGGRYPRGPLLKCTTRFH